MVGNECDLVLVLAKMPTLTGSWQVCTSGIQSFPGLTEQVQLGWGVLGPHSFQFWQKKVVLVANRRKPRKNNRAFCRLQWHRGPGALGWPMCLFPCLLFTGRHWLYRKLTSRHKAKDYAYHMKEHLYCNTTKKGGNQLKEANVCWVLQDFGSLASLFTAPRALPE